MAFIAEIFFQFLFEGLANLGFHKLSGKRRPHPFVSAFGAISLSLLEKPFLNEQAWRIANMVITPVILGFAMAHMEKHRTKKRKKTVRLETFFNAYLFALGFALIRFFFAK